ncbi:MAG: restriction endonuclease subunit S [Myxococcales bacterium]|nr:restriction endonuclease subunit S [Myxococcales bacterium]
MSEWPAVALGDIFTIARGGSPRPIDAFITDDPKGVNWIMIGDAVEGSKYIATTKKRIRVEGISRSREVKPGDFLLTNSMSFGHPYILATSGCIHDGWLVLSPRNENVDQNYFYHLLGSPILYAQFERLAAGAVVKNLNSELVRGVRVPLPPLPEQRRIADILDKADAIRRKRKEAIALTEELLRSAFLEMFGDPVTNPKGWEVKALVELADIATGVTKGKKYGDKPMVTLPYMRVANVQDGHLVLDEVKTITVSEEDGRRYLLQVGDVLLTEGGDPDKLGRGTVWRGEVPNCIHQNHIFRVRPSDGVRSEFLSAIISSERGKRYFLRAAKQTTGIATINMTQLKAFPVLVPPRKFQAEFVLLQARIDAFRTRLTLGVKQFDQLFTSLVDGAFRGELTKIDGSGEPQLGRLDAEEPG